MLRLLRTSRFLPLFLTQALGALNDNLFKNAMVILIVFRSAEHGAALAAAAGGVFILPYALFSALAGQAADRWDKARLIRLTKVLELLLMLLAARALLSGSVPGLMAVLFGLGVQATLFGPLKYGILPQLLAPTELVAGNALIEAATFAAILAGTILGGVLIGLWLGPALVAVACIAVAGLGLVASCWVPSVPPASPGLRIGWNAVTETVGLVLAARRQKVVWRAVLGISWFWALGATYLALFPVLVRDVFHGDNRVVTLLLAGFALGVGLGAVLGGRLMGGRIRMGLAAPAALVLSAATAGFAILGHTPWAASWHSPVAMLGDPAGVAAWTCLLAAAASGGVFSLPLYAALQVAAEPAHRARMVAANNVMNAVFMVAGAAVIAGLAAAGLGPGAILGLAAVLNLGAAWRFRVHRPVTEASPH